MGSQSARINNDAKGLALAGSIRISVKDNGAGLRQDQLRHLFKEGVQFDANKLQAGGGSGLGLFITKWIVEHHGGNIRAESQGPGKGCTFWIELPLFQVPLPSKPNALRRSIQSTLTESTYKEENQKHRVLVVDDALLNRKMLVRLLERSGHTCVSACNGQEALDAFMADRMEVETTPGHVPFDTILMDYEMPIMSGPDATKLIREQGCNALIFGVTGNVLQEDVAHFKSMGANAVLSKPVNFALIEDFWTSHHDHPD